MAQISVSPIILRNVLLRITGVGSATGTGDFEKHVSQVEFTPSTSPVTWKGLEPTATFSKTPTATWTCTLSFAQDWETTDSLSLFLYENEGEELACLFEPEAGGAGWESTIQITPGAIGGTVDTVAVASVTLGCTKPTVAA